MTCICCEGKMSENVTVYFEQAGNCSVIIKNVPCWKCEQCGETAFSGTVMRRLEEIVSELKKTMSEVSVVNYSAAWKGIQKLQQRLQFRGWKQVCRGQQGKRFHKCNRVSLNCWKIVCGIYKISMKFMLFGKIFWKTLAKPSCICYTVNTERD